ncbi:MAG: hypothetical protein J5I99_04545 [Verrucomicrobia bacterium]|nr:hypothetical protein [Verrucomicrobiota bacterium]
MTVGFPYARTVLVVESYRGTQVNPGEPTRRYYLSSLPRDERAPQQWMNAVRGHWGGVANRNHWRKDACWFEDKTRSRNPNTVGALILLRNAVLRIYVDEQDTHPNLPGFTEAMAADTTYALRSITRRL